MGKWGNGFDRRNKLCAAGYDPDAVQSIVNALIEGDSGSPMEEAYTPITGTETLKIKIDLTRYNSLEIEFTEGEE